MALTVSGVLITREVTRRSKNEEYEWTKSDAGLLVLAAITDLEAAIPRVVSAETRLGEVSDRITDRIATNVLELRLARRGELPKSLFTVNIVRTLGIMGLRQFARTRDCNSEDFRYAKVLKTSAALRQSPISNVLRKRRKCSCSRFTRMEQH